MKVLVYFLALLPVQASASFWDNFNPRSSAPSYAWRVTRYWNADLEDKFSEFVEILGESKCKTLHSCLTSPDSNPFYADRTPRTKQFIADCADFPYTLRMYFSWMEGLPFDYVAGVAQAQPQMEDSTDIRYTKYGNKPAVMRSYTYGHVYDGYKEMIRLVNSVSTATYRMHYKYMTDFFPVEIEQGVVRPGTIVYDPAGHAAMVYRVEKDGRLRLIDAHPDQSITRITYDKKFSRSRPEHGAGLRNWRPELDRTKTEYLPYFSTEQFESSYSIEGHKLDYYEYLRVKLSGGQLSYDPVNELSNMMEEICVNLQDRVTAVNAAVKAGISSKAHPSRLPENIFGTVGEWEDYASPSRDARLKVAFIELKDDVSKFLDLYKQGSRRVRYTPKSSKYSQKCSSGDSYCYLVASLMSEYEKNVMSSSCIVNYRNSKGAKVRLSYTDLVSRLFKLSFDPYHCVELRWGASSKEELASCRDDRSKLEWYTAEQGLRNLTDRDYEQKTNYGPDEVSRLGVSKTPDVDLWDLLATEL